MVDLTLCLLHHFRKLAKIENNISSALKCCCSNFCENGMQIKYFWRQKSSKLIATKKH